MLDHFFFVDQHDPSPEMKDYPEHSGPSQSRGSIILWVQQHREYRVWQKKLKNKKKNKTRANKKNKLENQNQGKKQEKNKKKTKKKQKKIKKKIKTCIFRSFFFFFFLFFFVFLVILPVGLFFWWFCFWFFFFFFFNFLLKSTFSVLHGVITIITVNSIVKPQKIVACVAHHLSWFIIIDHTFDYLCLVGFWYDCKSLLDTISTYITLYISVIYDSVCSRIWHKILFNK